MSEIFPELPASLGIYNLTQILGAYEESELYLAAQSYVDRMVVLEVLRPGCSAEAEEAFREAVRHRTAAQLPRVSPVLDSAQTDQMRYLIQEKPDGRTLPEYVAEEGGLSLVQAFGLVQAVAELYCACNEQGLAARAIGAETIFTDGEQYRFLSPVIAGEITDEQREVQMGALADALEMAMNPDELAASNIAVITHWLRHGYGGAPLQWRPLAASLDTLRKRRMKADQGLPLAQRLRAILTNKRQRKHMLKLAAAYAAIVLGMGALIGGLGALGAAYEWEPEPDLPAVSDAYVYCSNAEGETWRVQARPVSVAAYGEFLQALQQMTPQELADLHGDIPQDDHMPVEWTVQKTAAESGLTWLGNTMSPDSPVRGVSYEDALIYARYAGGEVADADSVFTARRHAGEPGAQEWTSSKTPEHFPHEAGYIVFPASGGELICETQPSARNLVRGFRIIFKK